jgi:hypothetical protein
MKGSSWPKNLKERGGFDYVNDGGLRFLHKYISCMSGKRMAMTTATS